MTTVQPFGDPKRASIFVIGHDPRLQRSKAEAQFAFFFEYLLEKRPTSRSEVQKYDLAKKVWDYMIHLAGREVPLESLYVTNLCNEFLPPTNERGTVLIPDGLAEQGLSSIEQAIAQGQFRVILPMSQQVNYHLARLGFLDEKNERTQAFVKGASPKPGQGVYVSTGKAPFLKMCGQRFHHQGAPVIPILHVKQWAMQGKGTRYQEAMEMAKGEVSAIWSV